MSTISCVICAYNEAARLRTILDTVSTCGFHDVVVVNDGSTDDTQALLAQYPSITVVSYEVNKGKTFALGAGIDHARGELIMLLDADLAGVTREALASLARPVQRGLADVSLSLRSNSLLLYRLMGLDFVTGERVLSRALAREFMAKSSHLPRWGGEVYMNQLIVQKKLSIAVVFWPTVRNVRKYSKVGFWKGFQEELRMMRDAFSVLSLFGTLRQLYILRARTVPIKYS